MINFNSRVGVSFGQNFKQGTVKTNSTVSPAISEPNNEEQILRTKLDLLFPNGELNRIYQKINRDFQIEYPAKLNFVYNKQGGVGGGYNFRKHKIEMDLIDLLGSNTKVVGYKNGRKIILTDPTHLPLFGPESVVKGLVQRQKQKFDLIFDKVEIEKVTPEEQKRLIIQKIVHECVHAKQHQMIRSAEGISDIDILKAWSHYVPKNPEDAKKFEKAAEETYKRTPWINIPTPKTKYPKGTPMHLKALELLNAIQNYAAPGTKEYLTNALEKDAYEISFQYINAARF